ncbi:MAG: type I-E CRISPR-associated protein Cse2/CasB [Bacteroidota bacterium]
MTPFEPIPLYRDRRGQPLRSPALYHRIKAEADVLRLWRGERQTPPLMTRPPWVVCRAGGDDENRGLRAAFRRWTPSGGPPTPEMEEAVHDHIPQDAPFRELPSEDQNAGVARLAVVLHLVALGWADNQARTVGSVGKACAGSDPSAVLISNTRFARLLTAPPEPVRRVEALGRAFRQFKRARLHVAPSDAPNLLRWLFSAEPEAAARIWAGDYFRITRPGEPAAADDPEGDGAPDSSSIDA